jgi:hypothetical protein
MLTGHDIICRGTVRACRELRNGPLLAIQMGRSEAWRPLNAAKGDAMDPLSSTQLEFDPVGQQARARAFLVLVLEADDALAGGARYGLDEVDEVTVGRGLKGEPRQAQRSTADGRRRLDIRAGGPFLSREHAVFRRTGDTWTVEEVRSQNGVQVNWE